MSMYEKESLEALRDRIDLVEVVGSHVHLQRSGSAFKARCPFHEEKTPSFIIQRGDKHYHCFGCGAHGDAIAFLMTHVKMGFSEAVESLAERFQVVLKKSDEAHPSGPNKIVLKQVLERASKFYHFLLLHTEEGHQALHYLYERGLDLSFIRAFEIGLALRTGDLLSRYLKEMGFAVDAIEQAGLLSARKRDFFADRITFPIRDAMGAVIGFSARKYREETFGGKYINTPETALFKKSHVLFGLSYSRQRIVKEKQAIIVEGQVDALQWIHAGFNYTVAGQGTAFGEGHVNELLHLGVQRVYLAMDGDTAGQDAAVKIGNLFQSRSIEVKVVVLPLGNDPDTVLKDRGKTYIQRLLDESRDYLRYVYDHWSRQYRLDSPSQKSEMLRKIATLIRGWEQPVMIHESLRYLANLAQVPEATLDVDHISLPDVVIKKSESVVPTVVDGHRILEADLLRWLLVLGTQEPKVVALAKVNIQPHHFYLQSALNLYSRYMDAYERHEPLDLLSLGMDLQGEEDLQFIAEIMQRKIHPQRGEEGMIETIHRMLMRYWMDEREKIRAKIQNGASSEEELLDWVRQFDNIKREVPTVSRVS